MSNMTVANRNLDAIPNPTDFRDKLFEPTLIEIPPQIELDDYRQYNVPVLDQTNEGACTGFGLATVANYLLRQRQIRPDKTPVSPRMFYEMAKRHHHTYYNRVRERANATNNFELQFNAYVQFHLRAEVYFKGVEESLTLWRYPNF